MTNRAVGYYLPINRYSFHIHGINSLDFIGVKLKITDKIGLVHSSQICKKLYMDFGVSTIIDLGAGKNPQEKICSDLGVRQLLIDLGYPESSSTRIQRRMINILDFTSIEKAILEFTEGGVDAVVSIGNIEHLKREEGELLLNRVENWAKKLVIFETPNGFVHQGPVDNNIYQIHLSGWAPQDFYKRGYKVYGTTGLKILKKDSNKGQYKFPIRGMRLLDVLLSRILFAKYFPSLCFNFIAFKIIE